MGLTRWLAKAGVDPEWFKRVATRGFATKSFGAPLEPGRQGSDAPAEGDSPSARLKPVVETGEQQLYGPHDAADVDRTRCVAEPGPSGGSADLWGARDANGEHMPSALSSMLKGKSGALRPQRESVRRAQAPGFPLRMDAHAAASTLLRAM